MKIPRVERARRCGLIAPLLAVLLIPLLGMIAFSVDVGYLIAVRTELQNAADAAALAGSQQLMNGYVQYYTPANSGNQATIYSNTITAARATAKTVAAQNTAGGVKIRLQDGTPNYDVTVGYYDGTTFTGSASTWQSGATFPNTVRVTARRDSTGDASSTNTPVHLFFGPVFGQSTMDQQAYAQASIYTINSLSSFQDVANLHIGMIPATFDVAVWQDYMQNGGSGVLGSSNLPPQYAGAALQTDGNGNYALQIYDSNKSQGNFGSLPIDAQHTGNLASQITSGMTQSLFETLVGNNGNSSTPIVPLAPFDLSTLNPVNNTVPAGDHNPDLAPSGGGPSGSWNWQGDPGFRAVDASTLNANQGIYLLPLFRAYDDGQNKGAGNSPTNSPQSSGSYQAGIGQGSSYYYNIVDFVAVQVVSVPGMKSNRQVFVEPSAMVLDLNQIVGSNPQLAGPPTSGSQLHTIFAAPKLTQ